MLAKIISSTIVGVAGKPVNVEVDVAQRGFPSFTIVGLPHKSIEEAKERVRTSIVNAGYSMPECRITVNLAPADLPKTGSGFDLPIAIGLLIGNTVIPEQAVVNKLIIGELSLNGTVKTIKGVLAAVKTASELGLKEVFVPFGNAEEASLVKSIVVRPVRTLKELVSHLKESKPLPSYQSSLSVHIKRSEDIFGSIHGQATPKRALEIAAAGFHNVHMKGPPGSGKTALARAFPSILPPLSETELLETCTIYSSSGYAVDELLQYKRPFRAPHHTLSRHGLIGGGNPPKAGEITLAHRGVLFLDEVPEFPRSALESLRQPVEDGIVHISRSGVSYIFPCRFQLITASNPCPCGYLGHAEKQCTCGLAQISAYQNRMSGPFLDRIDIHVDVPAVPLEMLIKNTENESSNSIYERVLQAKEIQYKRFKESSIKSNAEIPAKDLKKFIEIEKEGENLLQQAAKRLSFSAREYYRTLRVAKTIADLDCCKNIKIKHLSESLQYRKITLDK